MPRVPAVPGLGSAVAGAKLYLATVFSAPLAVIRKRAFLTACASSVASGLDAPACPGTTNSEALASSLMSFETEAGAKSWPTYMLTGNLDLRVPSRSSPVVFKYHKGAQTIELVFRLQVELGAPKRHLHLRPRSVRQARSLLRNVHRLAPRGLRRQHQSAHRQSNQGLHPPWFAEKLVSLPAGKKASSRYFPRIATTATVIVLVVASAVGLATTKRATGQAG